MDKIVSQSKQPSGGQQIDTCVLIALGSNAVSRFGDAAETVAAAIEAIPIPALRIERKSALYATPCFPAGAGPDFVNAVLLLRTSLTPSGVLAHLHEIERDFGRERRERWGQRCIDLDLLAFGDLVLPDHAEFSRWLDLPLEDQKSVAPDALILPHPRIQDRGFVLVPMADVAPEWEHPVLKRTVIQMLESLPEGEKAEIRPI